VKFVDVPVTIRVEAPDDADMASVAREAMAQITGNRPVRVQTLRTGQIVEAGLKPAPGVGAPGFGSCSVRIHRALLRGALREDKLPPPENTGVESASEADALAAVCVLPGAEFTVIREVRFQGPQDAVLHQLLCSLPEGRPWMCRSTGLTITARTVSVRTEKDEWEAATPDLEPSS
jgi:hypothetical protein